MKKKQKKHRRGSILTQKPTYSPRVIERIGLLSIGRQEALIRQLDTATWLWFQDQEPLSIHLVVMAAYNILHELGFSPVPLDEIDLAKSYTVYDSLRHSATKNLNESIDFVPSKWQFAVRDHKSVCESVRGIYSANARARGVRAGPSYQLP